MSMSAVLDARELAERLAAAEAAIQSLRGSEERYRRIVETANEGISILDTESRFTFVNQRFADMLGYPAAELLGKPLLHIVPFEAEAKTRQRMARQRQGISEELEIAYRRSDGSELWALLKTSPVLDPDGTWTGTLGMMTDWTQHRATEEALRKSEAQYRQIVETTTDGIIKTDADARIVFLNGRLATMLGYAPPELIGRSVFDLMSASGRLVAAAAFQRRQQGMEDAIDTTYRHKDGTEVFVNVAGSSLVDSQGRFDGTLGVVRNVTEQKRLQSQLMVSDRMASVGTLAAGVAHEINNPLAALIGNLDCVAESLRRIVAGDAGPARPAATDAWIREELAGPLDDARDAAERVRLIVRDLKVLSRSPDEEPNGPADVELIMESSIRMAFNEIRHRAQLVRHYGQVPPVAANEARLGQVFLNLLINAAQALPEGRAEHNEIRVSTRLDDGHVIIEISDTGPGIPPEIIGRIFDAFFTTKAVGVGTGLGLAICHRIVTDMGGALTVTSEPGLGATFRVALPVALDAPTGTDLRVAPASAAGRRGRILVVDDEPLLLRIVDRVLSREHDIVPVASAREALALCAAGEQFDLILCDLMMPDMTGQDLHRELSHVAPEHAGRMIFMTGGAFTATARQFLADTPNEHVEKPFDSTNLRAIVRRYLEWRS